MTRLPGKIALSIIVLLIVIGLVNCASTNRGTGESKINWLYDWTEASSKAQAENKPIMISFYTDICPTCEKLDSDTYSNDELSAFLNTNFICLKSNTTKNNLYQNYSNIDYVPTIIFSSPDGTEIDRIVGYLPPNEFLQDAQVVLSQWEP